MTNDYAVVFAGELITVEQLDRIDAYLKDQLRRLPWRHRQVRSARSLPKFCHSAAHFFIGSILFASLVTAFLATVVSLESVFLYDRRFPLWLLQRLRYLTVYQSRDCSGVLCGGIMGDIADAEERLQNPTLGNPEKPQA